MSRAPVGAAVMGRRLGAGAVYQAHRPSYGVNLNQMARALNSRAVSSPAETQAAVERVSAPL